jgi:hypothetical protein
VLVGLLSAICYLLSAVCYLLSAICYISNIQVYRAYEFSPFDLAILFSFCNKGKGEAKFETEEFKSSARDSASTLDFIVGSLGPDIDLLYTELIDMGNRSGAMSKIRPEHWNLLRTSLFSALETALGDAVFSEKVRQCWTEVFEAITNAMIKVLRPTRRRSIM